MLFSLGAVSARGLMSSGHPAGGTVIRRCFNHALTLPNADKLESVLLSAVPRGHLPLRSMDYRPSCALQYYASVARRSSSQELCESRGGRPGLPSLINLRFLWT